MNELLLWASAVGSGTSGSFKRKAAELLPPRRSGPSVYSRSIWSLGSLAHCEFGAAAAGGWRIAPPVLAAGAPIGAVSAVLCGARSSVLLTRLSTAAGEGLSSTVQAEAPDLIKVTMPTAGDLLWVSRAAGIPVQWNAPLAVLSAFAPPTLGGCAEIMLPTGGWAVERFSRSALAWAPSSVAEAGSKQFGLFRFKADYHTIHVFRQGSITREVPPALAKYWVLGKRQRVMRLDLSSGVVSFPLTMRPPDLIDRALVVASGCLPTLSDNGLTYSGISASVASAVAAALRTIAQGAKT